MLLQRFGLTWNMLLAAAGLGVTAFVALMLALRVATRILGPLFEYETVRLARKGHAFRLRTYFVLIMFAVLFLSSPGAKLQWILGAALGSSPANAEAGNEHSIESEQVEMERLASAFNVNFLIALGFAALAITPMYLATAVTELKASRMLDFLLATQITSREIIVGKLAARMLPVAGVLASALPILLLTQLWGSVDWRQIAFGFTVILIAMGTFAAVSMFCSVVFTHSRAAIAAAYIVLGVPELVLLIAGSRLSTIELLLQSGEMFYAIDSRETRLDVEFGWLLMYASAHLVVTCVCLVAANYCLRPFATRHQGGARRVIKATPRGERPKRTMPSSRTLAPNPPIASDPLVWKERYTGRTTAGRLLSTTAWVGLYLLLGAALTTALINAGSGGQALTLSKSTDAWRLLVVGIGALTLVSISLRLLASVSREREQQTLATLLTLPISRPHVLYAKWIGTVLRARAALAGVVLAFVTVAIVGHVDPRAWYLLPLSYAAHLCFYGNLALLLSVLCRSTTLAYVFFAAIVAVLIGGAWTMSLLEPMPPPPPGLPPSWTGTDAEWEEHRPGTMNDCLNPPQTWWRLTVHSRVALRYKYSNPYRTSEFDSPGQDWFGWRRIAIGSLVYLVLGVMFWLLAVRIFRRQTVQ